MTPRITFNDEHTRLEEGVAVLEWIDLKNFTALSKARRKLKAVDAHPLILDRETMDRDTRRPDVPWTVQ